MTAGQLNYIKDKFVFCKFCKAVIDSTSESSHFHDGGWVGECCWDERLRTTE